MQVSCALFKLYRQNREGLDIENKAVASILRHEPTLSLTSVKILSKNVEFDSLDGLVKSQIRSLREHFWDSFFAPLNRGTE